MQDIYLVQCLYEFHSREGRVLQKNLEELAKQILLRPDHSGTSSAVLIVFGPSIC